jgi:hypothetical protein
LVTGPAWRCVGPRRRAGLVRPAAKGTSMKRYRRWLEVVVRVSVAIVMISGVLRWPGYGREWVWPHLLVMIRAARTPNERSAEQHTANLFDVPRPSARTERWRRRLRHKAICHRPAVVEAIADWIVGREPYLQHRQFRTMFSTRSSTALSTRACPTAGPAPKSGCAGLQDLSNARREASHRSVRSVRSPEATGPHDVVVT